MAKTRQDRDAVLISFCNQSASPLHALCLATADGNCRWLSPHILQSGAVDVLAGVTGVAWVPDGLLLVTQSEAPQLIRIPLAAGAQPLAMPLLRCRDPHSLVVLGDQLYMVSSGSNEIYRVALTGGVFGEEELYWQFPAVRHDRDEVHLNGLAAVGERLVASCFGARDADGKWARRGKLFFLDNGEVVCENLNQPHSPYFDEGVLYVAESAAHSVHAYRQHAGGFQLDWVSDVGGYARGIARQGGRLLVGLSARRQVSRSQKTLNEQGAAAGAASVVALDERGRMLARFASLDGYGREIYDLLPVAARQLPVSAEQPLLGRIHELEATFDRYSAELGRVWTLLRKKEAIFGAAQASLVSVIMPTFNRAHLIRQSVLSVLAQSYRNFELIIVDDGSTDDTASVIAAIEDSRIRYVRQENAGRSAARNRALALAQGEFIAFLDSDDLYLPDKLERQVAHLRAHPGTRMVYTSAHCIDEQGEMLAHKYLAQRSGALYQDIAFFTPVTITLPTVMLYRNILAQVGNFDEQMHRFEDTDMWRRISKVCWIEALPEFTCLLRTHADNALESQCPHQIEQAVDYYARKILREDTDVALTVRARGIVGLYRYYSDALLSVSDFAAVGLEMLKKERTYMRLAWTLPGLRPSIPLLKAVHRILYDCVCYAVRLLKVRVRGLLRAGRAMFINNKRRDQA